MSWSDAELDERIEDIIVDAYGDYEQLASFACVHRRWLGDGVE